MSISVCAACGQETFEDGLCRHHVAGADSWAESNKALCDLLHRGIVPPRVEEPDAQELALAEAQWALHVGAA